MNLADLMFWRKQSEVKESVAVKEVIDLQEAGGSTSGQQITQANVQNFVVKAVGNIDSDGGDFESPDVSLTEITDAINTDSYIKVAITKYAQLIFKAGYNIVGQNDAAAEYLRGRFRMMSFMTQIPMDVVWQQVADDLVAYSNAYLIKSRMDMTNVGGLQAKGIYDPKPVGGYYRVDPTTVTIKRDKSGTIKSYQQQSGGGTKKYKPTDVVHFYVDKPGGKAYGVPRIASALEDVKMLRKIEGNVLRLIYRYAMPLVQMKIGLSNDPAFMATDKEITDARKEIEKLTDDGIYITNERTDFKVVGVDGQAIDISKYLSYYEQRVFSALSLSNSQVGRGGAKQDADSMEEQVHDTVKYYQRIFKIIVENAIFPELLLEGGYNPIMNEKDICEFQFNEINLDTLIKQQTHQLNQYQGGLITLDEARQNNGYDTEKLDESRLFQARQNADKIDLLNAKTDGSDGSGSTTANDGKTGPDKSTKTSGAAKNTIQPKNQHGTGSVHVKESLNVAQPEVIEDVIEVKESVDDNTTAQNVEHYRKNFSAVHKKWNSMSNDIFENHKDAKAILSLGRNSIAKSLYYYIEQKGTEGYRQAIHDNRVRYKSDGDLSSSYFIILKHETDKRLDKIFKDIWSQLKDAKTREDTAAVFDKVAYRIRFLCESIAGKARWFVYVKTCADIGVDKVYVDFGNSDDRKEHKAVIKTNAFSFDDIPPYHAYCSCSIGSDEEGR